MVRIPAATYRIQFNAQFTLQDARKIVGYLHALGVSDIYASPVLRARKGSTHGYDVVDTSSINPELGTADDLSRLHDALAQNGMGLVLDVVPNHMAASHENAWWMSVLENGPQSRFLHYFDIDWSGNKVLLPMLGRPYGEALESGEIQLGFDSSIVCWTRSGTGSRTGASPAKPSTIAAFSTSRIWSAYGSRIRKCSTCTTGWCSS